MQVLEIVAAGDEAAAGGASDKIAQIRGSVREARNDL